MPDDNFVQLPHDRREDYHRKDAPHFSGPNFLSQNQQEDSIFINFKVPNKDMDADDYFDDGIRRIDFILVWKKGKIFPGAMSVGVTIITNSQ